MRLGIITSGYLPVPASKGGAVENLVENLISENEINENNIKMTIFSIYDEQAVELAKKYNKTDFEFIKTNILCSLLDRSVYFLAKNLLKKSNVNSYRYIFQRLDFLKKVSKKLKRTETIDKVLLENHATLFLALKWNKNYKKYADRYYYHVHNEMKDTYGCENIIKNSKKIICVSEFMTHRIQEKLQIDQKKFVVLKNGVDDSFFKGKLGIIEKDKLKEEFGIKKDEKVLLFTGRISAEKGIRETILAIEKVKYNNFKLLIVGSAFFNTNIKSKFEEEILESISKVQDKVIFTGFVDYNKISKLYQMADIAVLPSIWNDPAPLTIIESLASGLPIITTYSGGISEYANNKSAVFLERDENLVNNLAKSIDLLLNDEKKCKNMRKNSLDVSKELTKEKVYKNFINMIK